MKIESIYESTKVEYLELVYHKLSMTTNLLESLLIPPGISVPGLQALFLDCIHGQGPLGEPVLLSTLVVDLVVCC